MNTNITRKNYRDLLCVSLLLFLSCKPLRAVEYLITSDAGGNTPVSTLYFTGDTGTFNQSVYVWLRYTGAEASSWSGADAGQINSGSLELASSVFSSVYLSPPSQFSQTTTGWTDPGTTFTATGGNTGNPQVQATYLMAQDPFFFTPTYYALTTTAGTHLLGLGSATFTINTTQPSGATSPIFSTVTAGIVSGQQWVAQGGVTPFTPTATSFGVEISVPEPSTYATAALACAALCGVALKKRRNAKLVKTA